MNRNFIICLCLSAALLSSCASYNSEKLLHIKKGNTTTEVMNADGDVVESTPVTIKGDGLDPKASYVLVFSEMSAVANANIWMYAFKDNKLFYWGFPHQFQRHDDKEIRIFGELATKYLVEKEYLKATKQ